MLDAEQAARFREEALPHLDAVYRFALRLSGSPSDAEDLVQETFLRAYRSWAQFRPGTRCKSWLFTICRNLFLRQRERGRLHERTLTQAAAEEEAGAAAVDASVFAATRETDPEGRFFDSFLDAEVEAELDRLPEEFRTAVVLSDVEGLAYAEVAEVTGVPVGTVKSRLYRGRRLLQRRLYDYAVEMGYLHPKQEEA